MEFVAATVQAIGRCASTISEVTDICLNGLVSLLSNRNGMVYYQYSTIFWLYYEYLNLI